MADNPLHDYVQRYGLEETARRLSLTLGKPISAHGVRLRSAANPKNRTPVTWLAALGLPTEKGGSSENPPPKPVAGMPRQPLPTEPLPGSGQPEAVEPGEPESEATAGSGRRAEQTPAAPEDVDWVIPQPSVGLAAAAQERIKALHVFAGSAIATAADADGFENDRGVGGGIGLLWTDKADPIAEAWIAWAEEGNRFAASFVRMMGTGGAGASLALGYASLLGGTAYILGHMPDNEATRVIYGRYARYRTVVPEPERPGREPAPSTEPGVSANGDRAAGEGTEDQLGSAAFPPGI